LSAIVWILTPQVPAAVSGLVLPRLRRAGIIRGTATPGFPITGGVQSARSRRSSFAPSPDPGASAANPRRRPRRRTLSAPHYFFNGPVCY
jgi:hypothetical protein